MRICLDVRFRTESGSSSYIRQLIPRILAADTANEYLIIKYRDQEFDFEPSLKGIILCPSYSGLLYLLWTIFVLPFRLRERHVDVYHAMKLPGPFRTFSGQKIVTTIHSITAQYKGYFPREFKMQIFHRYADPALQRSDAVIAVSKFLRDYVEDHMKMPASRLHVIHHGVDPVFSQKDPAAVAAARVRHDTGDDYFLCAGNVFPVKNHETAVRALAALGPSYKGRLVVAGGRRSDHFRAVRGVAEELGVADRVRFLGLVEPAELAALMSGARALVMPSLTEGFGLAMLEAFRCGLPVVASNIGSLAEIGEDAAILIDDPRNHDAFSAAMKSLLDSPELQKELRRKSLDRAAGFTWEEAARAHVRLYTSVAAR